LSPIRGSSKGPKIKQINHTSSVINSQDPGSSMLIKPPLYTYVDALLAPSPSSSPLLSKNSSPRFSNESSSNTKVKRKRKKKPGSDRRNRKYWQKSSACSADLNQVLSLYHAEHISASEAKFMLKNTLEISISIGYHVVPYIMDHIFDDHFKDLIH